MLSKVKRVRRSDVKSFTFSPGSKVMVWRVAQKQGSRATRQSQVKNHFDGNHSRPPRCVIGLNAVRQPVPKIMVAYIAVRSREKCVRSYGSDEMKS